MAVAAFAAPSRATLPGANGQIAFSSGGDVYVMNATGAAPRLVVAGAFSPTWSPDGKRLAVVKRLPGPCAPCNFEIDIADLKTGATSKVTEGIAFDPAPTWSPDGRSLAFSALPYGVEEIFSVNVDGSDVRQLTNRQSSFHPAWSSDGSRIAFDGFSDTGWQIYVMNADGSGLRQLTQGGGSYPAQAFNLRPAWSPDGTKIAYATDSGGSFEVWTMNADGTGATRLTSDSPPSPCRTPPYGCFLSHLYPAWSPDGTKIVFASDPADGGILTVNSDGTGSVQIAPASGAIDPEWQSAVDVRLAARAGRPTVVSGHAVSFGITLTNAGLRTATGVSVSATVGGKITRLTVPRGCSRSATRIVCQIGNLQPTGSATVTLTGFAASAGKLTLGATVNANEANASIATARAAISVRRK